MTGIDWAGLSMRTVLGWLRGTQCLAHCSSMHRGGRWCLTGRPTRSPLRRRAAQLRCALTGGHTGGRPLGAVYLCGRCRCVIDITTGKARR